MVRRLLIGLILVFNCSVYGQNKINQSQKIADLMEIKKEFGQLERTFQVQIFTGKVEEAKEEVKKAEKVTNLPVVMVFESPNFKVRVGKFRTRIEAERNLYIIKKNYPNAFLIEPY